MSGKLIERHVPVPSSPGIELRDLRGREGFAAHPLPAEDCARLQAVALSNNRDISAGRVARSRPRDDFKVGFHPRTLRAHPPAVASPLGGAV